MDTRTGRNVFPSCINPPRRRATPFSNIGPAFKFRRSKCALMGIKVENSSSFKSTVRLYQERCRYFIFLAPILRAKRVSNKEAGQTWTERILSGDPLSAGTKHDRSSGLIASLQSRSMCKGANKTAVTVASGHRLKRFRFHVSPLFYRFFARNSLITHTGNRAFLYDRQLSGHMVAPCPRWINSKH